MDHIKNTMKLITINSPSSRIPDNQDEAPTRKVTPNPAAAPVTIAEVHEPPRDISISSVEEFLPQSDLGDCLNSRRMTTQLV